MFNSNLINLNLQLFAVDTGGTGGGSKTPSNEEAGTDKTYTQEELDKLVQSASDRRVTEALETAKAKWEAEKAQELEKRLAENERLAKLTADEKAAELLKQKEKELAERDQAIKLKELQFDTIKTLAEEGLPAAFADFLIGKDADSTNNNIKEFKSSWQTELAKAVDDRIKGNPPAINKNSGADQTMHSFAEIANKASIRK